jgi:hypothetical protein
MARVRGHPRRDDEGRVSWVHEYSRRPITVRIYDPDRDYPEDFISQAAIKETAPYAFVDETQPDIIFLRAVPDWRFERIPPMISHETLHAAIARIGEPAGTASSLDKHPRGGSYGGLRGGARTRSGLGKHRVKWG